MRALWGLPARFARYGGIGLVAPIGGLRFIVGPEETRRGTMAFIDANAMKHDERLPGWRGRHWRSDQMSFAHYDIDAGSSIHEHHHPHEEVWVVIEGELEVTVAGETRM